MISARKKNRIAIFSVAAIILFSSMVSCARSPSVRSISKNEIREALAVPHPRVHFPFDTEELLASDVQYLEENTEWMKRHKGAVVILEGHCDEIGPSEYNMELGDRRARSVKAHLVERGIDHGRVIMVVSYGDTKPLDPSHSKEAWKMNRRVEFIIR